MEQAEGLSNLAAAFSSYASRFAALPLLLILVLPLALSLALIAPLVLDTAAFASMLAHPQFAGGLALSLWTGLAATVLSLLLAVLIVARARWLPSAAVGAMLSVPHLAIAIGLAFLIAPTGVIARLIAVFVTGWTAPPQWIAAQDPWGLSLIVALVLKETPFLLFALVSLMSREDLRRSLDFQMRVARSLGQGSRSIWLKLMLPQLLPLMAWPIIAVLSYGMTVVDMALVIGPTQPPTLAVVIWRDLNDVDRAMNDRGAAGVLILSGAIFALLFAAWLTLRGSAAARSFFYTRPARVEGRMGRTSLLLPIFIALYAVIALVLVLQSVSGHWPFPDLLAAVFNLRGWSILLGESRAVLASLSLALLAATVALIAAVAWLETVNPALDRVALAACALSLCLPALLLGLGQYRLFLALGVTGTAAALFFVHVLPAAAYVFLMLHGPYRGFDPQWRAVSSGLGQSRGRYLLLVKWPLLKSPLAAAWAVGFAVSMAQYVPAQLAAAGRYTTLPIETVTLSSGGDRAVIAASALLLMLLPLIAFAAAARVGRPRWSF